MLAEKDSNIEKEKVEKCMNSVLQGLSYLGIDGEKACINAAVICLTKKYRNIEILVQECISNHKNK